MARDGRAASSQPTSGGVGEPAPDVEFGCELSRRTDWTNGPGAGTVYRPSPFLAMRFRVDRLSRALSGAALGLAMLPAAHAQPDPLALAREARAAGERNRAYGLALDRLRDVPRDTAALALRLALEEDGAPGGLPFFQRRRMRRTARTLLRLDSTHVRAHVVLGRAALDDVLLVQNKVTLGEGGGAGRLPDDLAAFLEEAPLPSSTGRLDLRVALRDRGYVDGSASAAASAETAESHFRAALGARAADADALRQLATLLLATRQLGALAELADAATAARPERADGWMLAGLAAVEAGDVGAADHAFGRARARLSPSDRARLDDVSSLVPRGERADAPSFWAANDPRLLTDVHERRLEHYARRVAADLLFSRDDTPGAETDRGRIYVRYGAPPIRRLVTLGPFAPPLYPGDPEDTARYDVWQYPDFRYVFSDFFLSGRYTLYSPSADAFAAGTRTASQAALDDAVQTDRQLQRDQPERGTLARGTVRLDGLATSFRAADGQTDLVVALGAQGAPGSGRTGVFLVQDGGPSAREVRSGTRIRTDDGWLEAATLRTSPGPYTLALEAETPGGFGSVRQPVEIPAFAPGGLRISGLLLATSIDDAVGAGVLRRGGLAIVPAARARFAPGDPLYVYAELYGLALRDGRSDASVETALVPIDARPPLRRAWDRLAGRRGRTSVSVATDLSGDLADESVPLYLDTTGQPPGRYRLQIRVRDRASGATTETEREVELATE